MAACTDWTDCPERRTHPLGYTTAMSDADRHIDRMHADGIVSRKQKLTEDAIAIVGELADILGVEGKALLCVVHRGKQPTRCPVCALASVRNARGFRRLEHVYASGR